MSEKLIDFAQVSELMGINYGRMKRVKSKLPGLPKPAVRTDRKTEYFSLADITAYIADIHSAILGIERAMRKSRAGVDRGTGKAMQKQQLDLTLAQQFLTAKFIR